MLDAVRAPLALRYLSEDERAAIQQLVNDIILRRLLEVFEGMLKRRCEHKKDIRRIISRT